MSAAKKPYSRKVLWLVGGAVVLAAFFAAVIAMISDPKAARQAKKDAEKAAKIEKQEGGTFEGGEEAVAALDRKLEREREMQERLARRERLNTPADKPAATGQGGYPDLDPELLSKLELFDQAQKSVQAGMDNRDASQSPGSTPVQDRNQGGLFGGVSTSRRDRQSGVTEVDLNKQPRPGATSPSQSDDLFAGDTAGTGVTETYGTTKPKSAPSRRVVNEGVVIPAVLLTAFDTRNPGRISAMVTRDVYDSKSHMLLLIPKGSRLVGEVSSQVDAGAERVPGEFSRLILPDGRAFDAAALQGSGLDGSPGIEGRYHSNFLRAIGPAFVVAVLGNFVDREFPDKRVTRQDGTTYEAPSVMQQVTPKLSEKVAERSGSAKQYWTAKPGDEIRITLTKDLEVPEGKSP